jgi:type II secretory ATPase GspE/PulE/Tfp pilus assembly ATPase PilB-like protein
LTDAIELRASDIHLEPFEDELRIRYRIDGVLQEIPGAGADQALSSRPSFRASRF